MTVACVHCVAPGISSNRWFSRQSTRMRPAVQHRGRVAAELVEGSGGGEVELGVAEGGAVVGPVVSVAGGLDPLASSDPPSPARWATPTIAPPTTPIAPITSQIATTRLVPLCSKNRSR
jgi:hypothetical protein